MKKLGKIETVSFGHGGYQDACIGIHFTFSFNGTGCCTSKCAWDANMVDASEYTKWTEEDRSKQYDEIVRYISSLLNDAKVNSIDKLKNIPIEAEFDGNALKDWRILTEVI